VRKINDYYSRKAKKEKYPARSIYKLEEVQQKHGIMRRGDSVLDLGCFPGSWSLYASEVVGEKGIVVGIDLQQAEQSPRAGGAPIHWLCQDIMEPELLAMVRKFRPAFRVLISDLAPKTTGNRWADAQKSLELVRHTLKLADELLLNKGNFVCKVFQGEDFPAFVDEMKERFAKVKVVKPQSSRVESREVFVVGIDFQKQ